MTNRKSCGDRSDTLFSWHWRSVETKSRRAFDSNIDEDADKFPGPFEENDFVCPRASHQPRRIGLTRPFTQHLQSSTNQTLINVPRRFVHDLEQMVIAALFNPFVDLIRHSSRRCIAPGRVTEYESIIEFDFVDQGAGLLVIIVRFARESDDDVSRDGDSLSCIADLPGKIGIFFGGISPVHRLQNPIRARLHRQVEVIDQFWQAPVGVNQVFAKSDRVRRSEAKTLQTLDFVDGIEQLHKRTLIVDLRKLVTAVEVYDLTEPAHCFVAARNKLDDFGHVAL